MTGDRPAPTQFLAQGVATVRSGIFLVAVVVVMVVVLVRDAGRPIVPYDEESARLIRDLGIHRDSDGLKCFVARDDLRFEEIDGKFKARLLDEERLPLIFKAGMTPDEILRNASRQAEGPTP